MKGACNGLDDDTMYPDEELKKTAPELYAADVEFAKSFCLVCPIKRDCLAGALMRKERHGVWGGHTPEERQDVLRRLEKLAAESGVLLGRAA